MLKNLAMCIVCFVLSGGIGCRGSGANRGADLAGATGRGTSAHLATAGGQVTRRDDGTIAVSSPNGSQVMLLKQEVVDGQEVGLYQVCDATGDKLQCGDWVRIDAATPCLQCFAEPCPCTNSACAPVCKPL